MTLIGEDNVTFICRYELIRRNQQFMNAESEIYRQQEIWLILNESKYLTIMTQYNNDTKNITDA